MDRVILTAIAKNQLMRVGPIARRRDERFLDRGYMPAKNRAEYARWTFDNCAKQVQARRPIGGTVLEIGPGGNLATTLLFLEAGCGRGICVDVFPMLSNQQDLYEELVNDAPALLERIEYRSPEAIEDTQLPDASADIIFSNACLEHVADPAVACRRMFELLKPGGVMTHGIDLRDHRDFDQPLEFLRYGDRTWRAASSRRINTNRWRASDWKSGLERAGFAEVVVEPKETMKVVKAERATMAGRFRGLPLDDLGVLLVEATATKPV